MDFKWIYGYTISYSKLGSIKILCKNSNVKGRDIVDDYYMYILYLVVGLIVINLKSKIP